MFKRILRSKTMQARVRWILAIVMVPPFAFFFHLWAGGRPTPGPGGSAGVIFGHPVPWEEFQEEYALVRRHAQNQLGTLPETLTPYIRQQAWNRLLLKAEARRQVALSDEELAHDIRKNPIFQRDGRFVPDLYFRIVRGSGLSPQAFEERLRDDRRIEKLLDSVKAQAKVTDEDVKTAYAKQHERLRATMVLIAPTTFEPQIKPGLTEDVLRHYYMTHQEAVQLPVTRAFEYIGMSLREASDHIGAVSAEEIDAYYDDHPDQFTQADGSVKPLTDVRDTIEQDRKTEKARKRLTDLAMDLEEDLDNGVRFVEIALTRGLFAHKTGPLERTAPSLPNGPTNSMVSEAFNIPVGKMTQVFDTALGVFLLLPLNETPARIPPFEAVREHVKALVVQERAREAAKTRLGELHDALLAKRKDGFTIEEAYRLLKIQPLRPAPFTREDPIEPVGHVPTVSETFFALKPGECSQALETPQGFLVGCLEERLPYDEGQFANDKDAFRKTLLDSTQQTQLDTWIQSLRTRARLKSFLDQPPSPQ